MGKRAGTRRESADSQQRELKTSMCWTECRCAVAETAGVSTGSWQQLALAAAGSTAARPRKRRATNHNQHKSFERLEKASLPRRLKTTIDTGGGRYDDGQTHAAGHMFQSHSVLLAVTPRAC